MLLCYVILCSAVVPICVSYQRERARVRCFSFLAPHFTFYFFTFFLQYKKNYFIRIARFCHISIIERLRSAFRRFVCNFAIAFCERALALRVCAIQIRAFAASLAWQFIQLCVAVVHLFPSSNWPFASTSCLFLLHEEKKDEHDEENVEHFHIDRSRIDCWIIPIKSK